MHKAFTISGLRVPIPYQACHCLKMQCGLAYSQPRELCPGFDGRGQGTRNLRRRLARLCLYLLIVQIETYGNVYMALVIACLEAVRISVSQSNISPDICACSAAAALEDAGILALSFCPLMVLAIALLLPTSFYIVTDILNLHSAVARPL